MERENKTLKVESENMNSVAKMVTQNMKESIETNKRWVACLKVVFSRSRNLILLILLQAGGWAQEDTVRERAIEAGNCHERSDATAIQQPDVADQPPDDGQQWIRTGCPATTRHRTTTDSEETWTLATHETHHWNGN